MKKRPRHKEDEEEDRSRIKRPKRGIARLPEEEDSEKDRYKRKRLK